MEINNFWDNSLPATGPSLSRQLINKAEEVLGVKLPPILLELLTIKNGGVTNALTFPVDEKTCLGDNYLPIDDFLGIIDESLTSKTNLLHSDYLIKEWGLPERQILLTGDGHWWISLNYSECEIPSVHFIDTERGQNILLAPTFGDFIKALQPRENGLANESNNRVVDNVIIWENFVAEDKLKELDERFLLQVNLRRRQKGLPEITKN